MPLLSTGFIKRTVTQIRTKIDDEWKNRLGNDILVGEGNEDSGLTNIQAPVIDLHAELEESLENIYVQTYPATASGQNLDNALKFIGLERIKEAFSKNNPSEPITFSGPDQALAAGTIIRPPGDDTRRFATDAIVTISGGTGNGNVTAVDAGPLTAPTGTLTELETPISGVTVTNTGDIIPGRLAETDEQARLRAASDTNAIGGATLDAIEARFRNEVPGVISARVIENDTDFFDGAGRPPHSYEIIVQGGADVDIFAMAWKTKPAGIQLVGAEVGTTPDLNGVLRTVRFSRPVQKTIFITAKIEIDGEFPEDQDIATDEMEQRMFDLAVVEFTLGKEILLHKFIAPVDETPGTTKITIEGSIDVPSPQDEENLPIAFNEEPVFLLANFKALIV